MKNIVITMLTILVLGLGGYLVYDKVIDKEINKEEDTNLTQENDFDSAEAKKLIDKYYAEGPTGGPNTFKTGYTEEIKRYLALKKSEYDKITYIWYEPFNSAREAIYYDDLNETYKYLFGETNDAAREDFSLGCKKFVYDKKQDVFIDASECGGVGTPKYFYGVKTAKEKDNKLVIDVVYAEFNIVGSYDENNVVYFKYNDTLNNSYDDKDIYGSESGKERENYDKFEEKYLEENSQKLPIYTFVFEKEDNHYIFNSMERK